MKLRLASSSPRRLELLKQLGHDVEVCAIAFDEVSGAENVVEEIVAANALGKGSAAAKVMGLEIPLVAADTVVALEGEILGKPQDVQEAKQMLRRLSGKCHRVLTGVAVFYEEQQLIEVTETKVWFRNLTEAEIEVYVATGEPLDKAGAYGIQGRGAILVDRIEGCYNNVVGLPLTRLYQMMAQIGVSDF